MRKRQVGTVFAIRSISREIFKKKNYPQNGVMRLDPEGRSFELLGKLPPERRKFVVSKVSEIVQLARYMGNEDAILFLTSPSSRRKWMVPGERKCDSCDNLMCALRAGQTR